MKQKRFLLAGWMVLCLGLGLPPGSGRAGPQAELEPGLELTKSAGLPDLNRTMLLSLAQAKRLAVDNNVDLENARRDLKLAELEITRARAAYDPYFQTDASYSSATKPTSQAVFGRTSETAAVNISTGINTVTGGSMSLDFRNTRQESDSVFTTLNPSYNTDISLNLRQPLLKNRFNNLRAMELAQKKNDYEQARLSLEAKVLELESQVEDAYWTLVRSRLDLEMRRKSLELAQRMDRMTKSQVKAGTAAPVSTLQSEANLASAKAALIRAENDYRKSQAALKVILNLQDRDLWSLELLPADLPRTRPVEYDKEQLLREAMANNFELNKLMLSIKNAEITNQMARNRTLPQLDFRGSVGLSGLSGKDHPRSQIVDTGFVIPNPLPPDQFPQPYIVERVTVPGTESPYAGDYWDAVENMLEGDNLSWSVGITLNVPVGNRAARTDLERTMINYQKLLSRLAYQKRQVVINLINLVYDMEASRRSLEAARDAARLQEKNLKTEEKKFSLGLNTSFEVLQAEEKYLEAKTQQITALIDYNKMAGRLERARQGYLETVAAPSLAGISAAASLTATSAAAAAGGAEQALLQQYAGMLPAGVDINTLKSLLP